VFLHGSKIDSMKQKIDLPVVVPYYDGMGNVGSKHKKYRGIKLPVYIEKDDAGFYVVECPVLRGCYTQGRTIDEALRNIREVILLVMEEKENQEILASYHPAELSLHTITL